jgi:preprotein translocase subunit SecG
MYKFLLVVHAIIAAAMVGVILMQRSEGGGLAGGGSPSGLMTARGAADFLTRATTILATLFVLLSIGLAGLATFNRTPAELDTSLAKQPVAAPAAPVSGVPLAGSNPGSQTVPTQTSSTSAVPLVAQPKAVSPPVAGTTKSRPAAAGEKQPAQKAAAVIPPPVVTTTAPAPATTPGNSSQ